MSYFYGLSDSNTMTRLRQDIMCGENRLIKHSSLPASLAKPTSLTRKGPTRPNFRGTAIMTVIFLHLKERAHFLPSPHPRLSHHHYSRFDVVGNTRRQRFFLNRPRRLHLTPIFFHPFALPHLVHSIATPRSWASYSTSTNNKMGLSSRYTDTLTSC